MPGRQTALVEVPPDDDIYTSILSDPTLSSLVCQPPSNSLHDQEKIARYRPGGFHPLSLGDTFKEGRYRVAHKLGWGGFSTVWLSRDNVSDQWVALKIATADSGNPSRELSTLQCLHQDSVSGFLPRLLDSFTLIGPNGTHQCLVFELLGPSVDTVVADYQTGGERLDSEVILLVARQLLEAIDATHKAGYGHGDISGSNMAFTASKLAHLSEEELFGVIGSPETTTLARADGKPLPPGLPTQLVRRVTWDEWIDEDEEDIRLFDWGEAFRHGAEPVKLAQPSDLKAPETILTDQFDYRIDLWRAGCTVYSLVFGKRPFQYFGEEFLIAQMINFVEELPTEWQSKWKTIRDSSGRNFALHGPEPELERRFRERVQEPELMNFLSVIQGLMRFLPQQRISAVEALALL